MSYNQQGQKDESEDNDLPDKLSPNILNSLPAVLRGMLRVNKQLYPEKISWIKSKPAYATSVAVATWIIVYFVAKSPSAEIKVATIIAVLAAIMALRYSDDRILLRFAELSFIVATGTALSSGIGLSINELGEMSISFQSGHVTWASIIPFAAGIVLCILHFIYEFCTKVIRILEYMTEK